MKIQVELTNPTKSDESPEFMQRQQDIDALLVLAKLCEVQLLVDDDIRAKARRRISSLIDKL